MPGAPRETCTARGEQAAQSFTSDASRFFPPTSFFFLSTDDVQASCLSQTWLPPTYRFFVLPLDVSLK